ncbi:hypothetical protein D9611_013120 [Ephemerocybe angulata]|uniref:CCHC-type domain-containing protein n=1 Tax=Ephemerocybe angulata TaxID=980116 RepID=A0A8H5FC85_9AGAR|nr:hypothetical protein D9611_013120 [Tulosesus angulatus]
MDLKHRAAEMMDQPTKTDLTKRFYNGLPITLRQEITKLGADPLHETAHQLLKYCVHIETANRTLHNSEVRRGVGAQIAYTGSGRFTWVTPKEGRTFFSKYHRERPARERNERVRVRSHFASARKEEERFRPRTPEPRNDSTPRPDATRGPRPSRPTPSSGLPRPSWQPRPTPAPGAKPANKCFTCGKEGHFSRDCPTRGPQDRRTTRPSVQFQAVREEGNNGGDEDDQREAQDETTEGQAGEESEWDQWEPTDNEEGEPYNDVYEYYDQDWEGQDEQLGALYEYMGAVRAGDDNETIERPIRKPSEKQSMVQWITINGVRALTLFDSGWTLDSISPQVASAANVQVKNLVKMVPLQLGVVSSRSVIHKGARGGFTFQGTTAKDEYFDILPVAKYDVVIGIPMMKKLGICLDFDQMVLRYRGGSIKPLDEKEESVVMARRAGMRNTFHQKVE